MAGVFHDLDDKAKFVDLVCKKYAATPPEIAALMHCDIEVDPSRVEYAFNEYQQNINKFKIYLNSKNPDHYKRAGALLHALHQSLVIKSFKLESSAEDLSAGFTRISKLDAEYIQKYALFYESYHNQFRAFDLAFQCCHAYEDDHHGYDFDYLWNVCRYLKEEKNLSVDSCFMVFKSLMLSTKSIAQSAAKFAA